MIVFAQDGYRGLALLLDVPFGDVIGIVECAVDGCLWRRVLTLDDGDGDEEAIACAIEAFLKDHPCCRGCSPDPTDPSGRSASSSGQRYRPRSRRNSRGGAA